MTSRQLQSGDAKIRKYEIMKTVVNIYLNEQTIKQTIFWKGEVTTTVQAINLWVLFLSVKRI